MFFAYCRSPWWAESISTAHSNSIRSPERCLSSRPKNVGFAHPTSSDLPASPHQHEPPPPSPHCLSLASFTESCMLLYIGHRGVIVVCLVIPETSTSVEEMMISPTTQNDVRTVGVTTRQTILGATWFLWIRSCNEHPLQHSRATNTNARTPTGVHTVAGIIFSSTIVAPCPWRDDLYVRARRSRSFAMLGVYS